MFVLRGALPPPVSEGPEAEARRDRAALAGVAALRPVNAAEGRLATQFVAADAWAMDCLRLAQEKRRESGVAFKCRAQALSLMREARRALRALQQMQKTRTGMDPPAADLAAWEAHAAAAMLAEVLEADAARETAQHRKGDGTRDAAGDTGGDMTTEGREAADGAAADSGFVPNDGTGAANPRSETNVRSRPAWAAEGAAPVGRQSGAPPGANPGTQSGAHPGAGMAGPT